MRVNVYTEELINGPGHGSLAEVVTAEYVSSRTGLSMKNYGLRVYLKSAPSLHYIPGRDDDRSAVTFWVGPDPKSIINFWEAVKTALEVNNLDQWRDKVLAATMQVEGSMTGRFTSDGTHIEELMPTVKNDQGQDVPCPDFSRGDKSCGRTDNYACERCPDRKTDPLFAAKRNIAS